MREEESPDCHAWGLPFPFVKSSPTRRLDSGEFHSVELSIFQRFHVISILIIDSKMSICKCTSCCTPTYSLVSSSFKASSNGSLQTAQNSPQSFLLGRLLSQMDLSSIHPALFHPKVPDQIRLCAYKSFQISCAADRAC